MNINSLDGLLLGQFVECEQRKEALKHDESDAIKYLSSQSASNLCHHVSSQASALFLLSYPGLCGSLQAFACIEKAIQKDPELPEDCEKAQEPGDLRAGENHQSR